MMNYSELTPNDEMKLIQYGLIDEDTITGDFPLSREQMMVLGYGAPAIQESSATPQANPQMPNYKFDTTTPTQQATQRAVDLMGNGGIPQAPVNPQGMIYDSLNAVQSSDPSMRSDTIDYTTKMSLDSQNQEMQQKQKEQELLDYKALIDSKNLNIGDKKAEFKTALQLQSILDSDQYPVEAKKYALQKLRNRFGLSFDKMVPVNDEYGRLKGARVQSKGAIDQGLDALFTAQARDFDDQKGYLESGFDKTMGLLGIGSRVLGHMQDHERSGADENTYYQTDEVKAIRDRQRATIPTLENAIGNLYMREQGIEDPTQKAKIRSTRVGLQKMLDAERSPSGMEAVAEFGSMALDPTILADLGLFLKGGKELMQLAKVDNALDATKGMIKKSRNLVDDGKVLDPLDDVVVNPFDEIASEVDEAPLNVSPMEEAKWSGEPSKVMPMPTFDNAPTQAQAPSGGSWPTKEMQMVPLNQLDQKGIPRVMTGAERAQQDYPNMQFIQTKEPNAYGAYEPRQWYHGSKDEIDQFDPDLSGELTNNNPNSVLYNTDDAETAKDYGRHSVTRNFNTDNYDDVKEFLDYVKENDPRYFKTLKKRIVTKGYIDDPKISIKNITDDDIIDSLGKVKEFRIYQSIMDRNGDFGEYWHRMPDVFKNFVDSKVKMNPSFIGARSSSDILSEDWAGMNINSPRMRYLWERDIQKSKQGYLDEKYDYLIEKTYEEAKWAPNDIENNMDEIQERAKDSFDKDFDELDEYDQAEVIDEVLEELGYEKEYPEIDDLDEVKETKKDVFHAENVRDPVVGNRPVNKMDIAITWDDKNRLKNLGQYDSMDFRSPNADATMRSVSSVSNLMTPRKATELSKQNKARYTSKGELTEGKFWKKDLDGSNGVKTMYSPADATQFKREGDNLIGLDPEVKVDGEMQKFGANKEIQKSADKYMDLAKEKYGVPKTDLNVYARIDPERSEAIAHEYEKMKHDPTNPEVRSAYAQLSKEMMDQYKTLIDDGWTFSFYPTDAKGNVIDPYGNPRNALKDMRENKHLYVYPTDDGFGTSATFDPNGNPLLAESGEKFGDKKAKLNDIFRAVHDVFGHGAEEVGFRARGEEHTWRSHARMFSPEARRALTSETRGQNSWLNFNPLTGKKNQTALVEDTDFADQKTGLMPKWVSESGLYDEDVVPHLNDLRSEKGLDQVTGSQNMPTTTKGARHSVGDKFGANKRVPAKFTGMDESIETPPSLIPEKDYTSNEGLNPIGKSLADVGKKISNSPKTINQAFGNFLQGIGVGVSELEANGLSGLANAIKQGGYRAFVTAPEKQKQAMMDLIFDRADVNKVIQELGAREGRLPKEFADQILETFASPKGGATGRAKEKQDKLWQGSKAREIEAEALGGKQYETPSKEISQWWDDFVKQKDPTTGELIDLPDDQRAIVEDIARSELGSALSSTALKKILGRAKQGKMSYPEILDTIRAIDNSLNWGAESSDAVEKVWELRKGLNDMIMGATRYQIESGALDDFFEGVDGVEAYEKLRKSLQNSTELKKDFLQYTKNKGKTSGLSDFEIDTMADKVANAFGKILSKQGQSGSKLENNTGYKILKRIDQKQGTDFADKVRVIWELYSNPQIEVKKIKGQNALAGYKLPARAQDDQWSQAEYFSKGNVADVVRKNWRSFKSLLMDWSQPRADLGATELNKQIVDVVSSLVGKVPTTFIFNELQKRNIPARQIAQLIRPALANKSGNANPKTSKDTSSKEDKKVMFNPKKKPLSEVGSK